MVRLAARQVRNQPPKQHSSPAGAPDTIRHKLLVPEGLRIFSGIHDHLLARVGAESCRAVLVCSVNSGEGTTFVAAGLAIAAAAKGGGPVLLIDGNVHSPKVCEVFSVTEHTGLGNLLAMSGETIAIVRQTPVTNLSVMGVGVLPNDYILALQSRKLHSLLEKWAATYQFIVVDGPAICPHPESLFYAPQVDRVLLVVRAGKTRAPVAAKALAQLAAVGCDRIELILNRRTLVLPPALYEKL